MHLDNTSNCRVILDCTDIFAQTPSFLLVNFYYTVTTNLTFKGLIGISPKGLNTFGLDLCVWGGGAV